MLDFDAKPSIHWTAKSIPHLKRGTKFINSSHEKPPGSTSLLYWIICFRGTMNKDYKVDNHIQQACNSLKNSAGIHQIGLWQPKYQAQAECHTSYISFTVILLILLVRTSVECISVASKNSEPPSWSRKVIIIERNEIVGEIESSTEQHTALNSHQNIQRVRYLPMTSFSDNYHFKVKHRGEAALRESCDNRKLSTRDKTRNLGFWCSKRSFVRLRIP